MTHWTRTLGLVFLCAWIFGCGDEFTAGFTAPGMLEAGAAGASGADTAGGGSGSAAGGPGAAGTSAAGAAEAGAPAEVGGAAGAVTAGAAGAAGGLATWTPCAPAIDVSGGYLAVQLDRCYRTKDHFSMLLCGGWGQRRMKVNGVPAECNAKIDLASSPAATDGYNYIEMSGEPPGAWLRWLEYTPPVPCDNPLTLTGASGPLPSGPVCIRTTDALNEVLTDDADGRSLVINGFQTSYNYQTGVPPSADGYIYLSIGPGKVGSSVSWTFVPLPTEPS